MKTHFVAPPRGKLPKSRHALALAAVLGTMVMPVATQAASGGSATLALRYELVDLNPTDGLAPWILISGSNTVGAQATEPIPSIDGGDYSGAKTPFGHAITHAQSASVVADASIAPGSAGVAAVAQASVRIATAPESQVGDRVYGHAVDVVRMQFTLAPQTRLILHGEGSAQSWQDAGAISADHARAWWAMWMYAGPTLSLVDHASLQTSAAIGGTDAEQGLRSVSFDNVGQDAVTGLAAAKVDVEAYLKLPAMPVPEPASGLLLAVGIGVIGVAARRGQGSSRADFRPPKARR